MNSFRPSRRNVLRGLLAGAAVTVGLPVFEFQMNTNGTAWADGTAFPRRFGMFFWGNGMLPDRWVPTGEGRDWVASEELAPLERHRDVMTIVSGMSVKTGNIIPHGSGPSGFLGGAPLLRRGGDRYTFSTPSIDQIVAREIGGDTRFRSIEFGAEGNGLSHNGPDSLNPPEQNPLALFERIFGAGFRAPGEESIVDPRIGLRRSVLDAVNADAAALNRRLGSADRARIDQHLTSVRELELRLARLEEDPPTLDACGRPAEPLPEYPRIDGRPQLRAANRAMCDIMAMCLACDQTRVFSNWLTHPINNLLFEGAEAGHHQLTHDEPGDQPQVHAIVLQLMDELAYMVDSLRNVPEGAGTLLDSCGLLATSDVSLGRIHSLDEYPILLFGSAGGALRTGIHYRSPNSQNASHVMFSLLQAMRIRVPSFGVEGGQVTEGLSDIEA